jgi:hypothetical protein
MHMVLTIEIHLSQRFAFQEPDDRTKVQLISLKGPSVSLLFPLRTASLRVPIGSLQGHLHKHVKRMCTKCRTQTTGSCRLKTEHYARKTKLYRYIGVRTVVAVCSWGLCLLVRATSVTLW